MRRVAFIFLAAVLVAAACGDRAGSDTPDEEQVRRDRDVGGAPGSDVGPEADVGVAGECVDDDDCSDGVFCNGIERCFESECFPSNVPQCSDPSECTEDVCDEENDRCEFVPDDSLCAPGQICDSKAGCFTPAQCVADEDCDDGLLCNGSERCVDGECEPGVPVECDDGIDCTVDSCVEGAGECQSVADHTRCVGTELCGLTSGCEARPPCQRDDDCDDGFFCNGTETCVDGVCQAGPEPEVVDSVDCTIDQCSESDDMVLHTPDDARCSDGQFCNGAEVCHPRDGCQAGTPRPTSDGIACTVDTCDEMLDFIEHTPDDSNCDDGQFCNGVETCHPTDGCSPGEPPVVSDGVGCTVDSCDDTTDEVLHVPDDSRCDDGLVCNGTETCDLTMDCQTGDPPMVDDGNVCTTDTCEEPDGATHTPVADGTGCGSGLICLSGSCETTACGDGFVDANAGETCDDGNTTAGDGCDSNCQTETTTCDPDGAYAVSPAIYFECGDDPGTPANDPLIVIDIDTMTFSNGAQTIVGTPYRQVNDSLGASQDPLTMTGAGGTCPSGDFSATVVFEVPSPFSGCEETYTVTGTWTDANTWTGTFTAEFVDVVGPISGSGCFDCVTNSPFEFDVTGSR